jgi:hypothetical protein
MRQTRLLHSITIFGACQSAAATCSWLHACLHMTIFLGLRSVASNSFLGLRLVTRENSWSFAKTETHSCLTPFIHDRCPMRHSVGSSQPSEAHKLMRGWSVLAISRDLRLTPNSSPSKERLNPDELNLWSRLASLSQKRHQHELGLNLRTCCGCCCKKCGIVL